MRAAAVITGVLAQFQKLFHINVPGFQVGTHRAFALAALVNRHSGVIGHFQEWNHAL